MNDHAGGSGSDRIWHCCKICRLKNVLKLAETIREAIQTVRKQQATTIFRLLPVFLIKEIMRW
jgi:hypothetical protein